MTVFIIADKHDQPIRYLRQIANLRKKYRIHYHDYGDEKDTISEFHLKILTRPTYVTVTSVAAWINKVWLFLIIHCISSKLRFLL